MKYYYSKRHKGIFHYFENGKRLYGFRITYFDNKHKRHEKSKRGLHSSKEAIQISNQVKKQVSNPDEYKSKSLNYWCHDFLKYIKNNIGYQRSDQKTISTYKVYKNRLLHNVTKYIGDIQVNKITPKLYRRRCLRILINKKHMTHKSVMNVNGCVKTLFKFIVDNGGLSRNQLIHVTPQRVNVTPERRQMSLKQFKHFMNVVDKQNITDQVIFHTLAESGIRVGELLALTWNDIDTKNNIIHIRHTRDDINVRLPKTKSSIRDLMVDNSLIKLLKHYYKYCHAKYGATKKSFIVLSNRGNPISPSSIPKKLKKLLVKAGYPELQGKFVDHSIRHMYASILLTHGFTALDVSKAMGHKSPDTTIKYYARHLPGRNINFGKAIHDIYDK